MQYIELGLINKTLPTILINLLAMFADLMLLCIIVGIMVKLKISVKEFGMLYYDMLKTFLVYFKKAFICLFNAITCPARVACCTCCKRCCGTSSQANVEEVPLNESNIPEIPIPNAAYYLDFSKKGYALVLIVVVFKLIVGTHSTIFVIRKCDGMDTEYMPPIIHSEVYDEKGVFKDDMYISEFPAENIVPNFNVIADQDLNSQVARLVDDDQKLSVVNEEKFKTVSDAPADQLSTSQVAVSANVEIESSIAQVKLNRGDMMHSKISIQETTIHPIDHEMELLEEPDLDKRRCLSTEVCQVQLMYMSLKYFINSF